MRYSYQRLPINTKINLKFSAEREVQYFTDHQYTGLMEVMKKASWQMYDMLFGLYVEKMKARVLFEKFNRSQKLKRSWRKFIFIFSTEKFQ